MSFTINQLTRPVDLLQADHLCFHPFRHEFEEPNYPIDGPASCGDVDSWNSCFSKRQANSSSGRTNSCGFERTNALPTVRKEGTLGIITLPVPEPRCGKCVQCRPIPLLGNQSSSASRTCCDSLFCYHKSLASIKANNQNRVTNGAQVKNKYNITSIRH